MGDMRDDFRTMREAAAKVRANKEPQRFAYAKEKLISADHTVEPTKNDPNCLTIDGYVKFWPYTGWFAGKGIGSGRGILSLIKKLEEKK